MRKVLTPAFAASLCALVLLWARPPAVQASLFSFTEIAAEGDPVPAGSGAFKRFTDPVLGGGTVAFWAVDEGPTSANDDDIPGVFKYTGGALSKVVTAGDPVPGQAGGVTFDGFSVSANPRIAIDNEGTIAFQGRFTVDGQSHNGIYTANSVQSRVMDTTTAFETANGLSDLSLVDDPSIGEGGVVFRAEENPKTVLTNAAGTLDVVVQNGDPVPGLPSRTFSTFDDHIGIDDGTVAVQGSVTGSDEGIYTWAAAGGLAKAFDTETTISPVSGVLFDDFLGPAIGGGNLLFKGEDVDDNEGIFTTLGGTLRTVAAESTPVPNSPGSTFTSFDPWMYAIDEETLAFLGRFSAGFSSPSQTGIFMERDGGTRRGRHLRRRAALGSVCTRLGLGFRPLARGKLVGVQGYSLRLERGHFSGRAAAGAGDPGAVAARAHGARPQRPRSMAARARSGGAVIPAKEPSPVSEIRDRITRRAPTRRTAFGGPLRS